MELSKKEKRTAREIIEKGLQKEFEQGLSEADAILKEWKNKTFDNRDSYHRLYSHIVDFNKRIASRYDGMKGSNYLLIIIGQLSDGIITEDDLSNFPEEIKQSLKQFVNFDNEN